MFNPVTKPKISSEFSPLIQLHNCDIYFQMYRHACFIKGVIKFSYQGLNVLFISTDNSIIKQTNIPCSCARRCLFLSENSRVLCKYKAKVAMRAMDGTVQEGSIPTWMEVVFVTTFFSRKFPEYFFGKIYMNQKQFDW